MIIEKVSSFLTLLSLPILSPALGRVFFDWYARRRRLPAEPTLLASRVTLMIALTALLSLYGVLWRADKNMVAWFKWGDGDIHVYSNVDGDVTVAGGDVTVNGKVDAEVSGHVDTN